jgi:uncharacterized protein involved in type VI secretion and phage assembly
MTALAAIAPVVTINGSPLAGERLSRLIGMRLERAIGLVGRGTLRFSDPGYEISSGGLFKLGAPVRISVAGGGLLMNATVTGVTLEQSMSDYPELVVAIDDVAQKLACGRRTETDLHGRWSEVISAIAARNGLAARVGATGPVERYTVQADSDLAFLNGIVERAGLMWWLDGPGADVLRVEKAGTSSGSVTLRLADDLESFSVQASVPPEVAPITTAADTDWAAGAVVASGACAVNDAIKPAVTLTIEQAGPASGSYQVRQVEHIYTQRGFQTRFVAGDPQPRIVADPHDRRSSPPIDPGRAVPGLLIGEVTNDVDPDSLGRIQLTDPGAEPGERTERIWARRTGASRAPAVGDKVVVGFEGGDSRRPIIVGVLRNAVDELDAGARTLGALATGHTGPGAGEIRQDADRLDIEVPSGSPLCIRAGKARFEIDADGSVTIAGLNVTIKAERAVTIEATAQMTAKSCGTTNVEGTKVRVRGLATTSVEGGAHLALKGGMVAIN